MNKETFIKELAKINISLTPTQLEQLAEYYHLLYEENQKYNLTTITEESEVYLKHFYDSITISKAIVLNDQYLCDVGTGAGFPGIVLKIVYPNLKVDLIDSNGKKCNFLNLVIKELKLENINVINTRTEEYAKETREKYDIITSRAVAPLKHLLEYSIPLLKVGGTFIALKANIDEELTNIDNYYKKLSLINEEIIRFKLPFEDSNRSIYKVTKNKSTPSIYPRQYNQIKKKDI